MTAPSPLQLSQYRSALKNFLEFTDEEWNIFSDTLYVKKLDRKQHFISEGSICNEVGFISRGSFRFYFVKDGVEISNYFCFRNELISAYGSFLNRTPGILFIEAMEDSELLVFSHASLQKLLTDPRVAYRMEQFGRKIAEYLIICYEERIYSFITLTPEERYLQLLDQQPEFLQQVPQHYLAHYLGITAVSLSRIRKRIFASGNKSKMAS